MSKSRISVLNRAQGLLQDLTYDSTRDFDGLPTTPPEVAAREYFRRYPRDMPVCLRYWSRSSRLAAQTEYDDPTTSAHKLFHLKNLRFYSLHLSDFGLSSDDASCRHLLEMFDPENPRRLYQTAALWQMTIQNSFRGPHLWKLEANSRRVMAHIVAPEGVCLLSLPTHEGSQLVKPVPDPVGMLAYMSKPAFAMKSVKGKPPPDIEEAIARLTIWIEHKRYFAELAINTCIYNHRLRASGFSVAESFVMPEKWAAYDGSLPNVRGYSDVQTKVPKKRKKFLPVTLG